ncbi:ninjurin-1-like [Agrilus planipennis]|uniref:Ninjurin-1-like n=1 Tax=Agrilus planipennis TaxID=224129 RepID=A0A1W4WC67_AGRPL|nr:ninjurin-1-like [Agrilus planipennis]
MANKGKTTTGKVDDENNTDTNNDASNGIVLGNVQQNRESEMRKITVVSELDEDGDDAAETVTTTNVVEEENTVIVIEDEADGKRKSNSFAAKKTVAQGMMDIALITANANQLRYIIEFNRHSSTFYVNLFLIIVSLILQVGVGVALIFKGRLDLKGKSKHQSAKTINNYVVAGIFLVTIINVFIASFTITNVPSS